MFDDVGCMFSNELKYIVGVPPKKNKSKGTKNEEIQ